MTDTEEKKEHCLNCPNCARGGCSVNHRKNFYHCNPQALESAYKQGKIDGLKQAKDIVDGLKNWNVEAVDDVSYHLFTIIDQLQKDKL